MGEAMYSGGALARLQKATGPDQELDRLITLLAGWREATPEEKDQNGVGGYYREDGSGRWLSDAFPWTGNVETALMLIPDSWTAWGVRSRRRKTAFVAYLSRLVDDDSDFPHGEEEITGHGSTPAIAICVVALKALRRVTEQHIILTAQKEDRSSVSRDSDG